MSTTQNCTALIVAAGHGVRAGEGLPKQYRLLAGKPVLRRTVEVFLAHPGIESVQVVISQEHRLLYDQATASMKLLPPVLGGPTRQDSVLRGLEALNDSPPQYVLVHDAARAMVGEL